MNWWALKRRIHTAWFLTYLCLGFLIGILLSGYVFLPRSFYLIAPILSFCVLIIYLPKRFIYIIPAIIICGLNFGLLRGLTIHEDLIFLNSIKNKIVYVKAEIKEEIVLTDTSFKVESPMIDNRKLNRDMIIDLSNSSFQGHDGDVIHFRGILIKSFNNFNKISVNVNDIKFISRREDNFILKIKDSFSNNIKKVLPEPHASLGLGYLIGQQYDLPITLMNSLQAVGLTHIIVASGYNLSVIVRITRRLFAKVSKYLSFLVSIFLILVFVGIAGLGPSVFRASLVSGLSLAAWYYGRRFHPITLIIFTMSITLLFNPNYILGDIGWQLSFLAFIGVMILSPLLACYLFGENKINAVFQILLETFSAQIMTLPIIMLAFGQMSNIAIIANLLVLPTIPVVMLLVFLAGLSGYLSTTFGYLFAAPAKYLIDYIIKAVEFLSDLPWASQSVSIDIRHVLIFYALVLVFTLYIWRITKCKLHNVNMVE